MIKMKQVTIITDWVDLRECLKNDVRLFITFGDYDRDENFQIKLDGQNKENYRLEGKFDLYDQDNLRELLRFSGFRIN